MPESDNQLQIRCPKCGQRFKVGPELEGRIVECGRCENRFRVNDEVIQRMKKFYPGEKRRDPSLDRFPRAPVGSVRQVAFQPVTYTEEVSAEMVDPPSVARVLAGLVGMGILVLSILLFVVSGATGGAVGAIPQTGRFVLAAFLALLGSGFFVYANRRKRGLAVLIALIMSAGLLSMPVWFPAPEDLGGLAGKVGGDANPGEDNAEPGSQAVAAEPDPAAELKRQIGYAPMEKELAQAKKPEAVAGLWLRGMQERNRFQVRDYMLRATGAGEASHLYPRSDTDFLFVLTDVRRELEEIAAACERVGRVERILRSLRVIEVVVDNERFVEGPIDRLSNREDNGFYALNLRELESIDLDRATRAVERLMDAPPTQFRSDIVRRMVQLLGEAELEEQGKIAKALAKWSVAGDGADEMVLKVALKADSEGKDVPDELVRYLVARGEVRVLPALHRMWLEDPEDWETLYVQMGPAGESKLLEVLATGEPRELQSALRILGRIGTDKSVGVIESFLATAKGEVRLLAEQSLAEIRKRVGN